MKKNRTIISAVIAFLLILLLANPKILPLSAAVKEKLAELEKQYMLIDRSGKITFAHILTLIMALCIVYLVFLAVRFLLEKLGKKGARSRTVTALLISILTYIAVIVATVWGLNILGVNTGAVLAGLGILGLILGFGAQSLIEDVITGFFIIFEGQYSIGDIIILDDFRGIVRNIGVRTTSIEDVGGNIKVVNNSDIRNFQNRSRNASKALSTPSVSYSTDLRKLEDLLDEALPKMFEENDDLYLAVPEYLGVEQLADSGLVLRFTVDTREEDVFIAQRQMNRDLKILFDENGIEIPFPQVVVHKAE